MSLFVDPPSGWKYGFPCEWNKEKYPELKDLYLAKGYPEKDINFALNYTRIWEEQDE